MILKIKSKKALKGSKINCTTLIKIKGGVRRSARTHAFPHFLKLAIRISRIINPIIMVKNPTEPTPLLKVKEFNEPMTLPIVSRKVLNHTITFKANQPPI